jgi:hypothetical protein
VRRDATLPDYGCVGGSDFKLKNLWTSCKWLNESCTPVVTIFFMALSTTFIMKKLLFCEEYYNFLIKISLHLRFRLNLRLLNYMFGYDYNLLFNNIRKVSKSMSNKHYNRQKHELTRNMPKTPLNLHKFAAQPVSKS